MLPLSLKCKFWRARCQFVFTSPSVESVRPTCLLLLYPAQHYNSTFGFIWKTAREQCAKGLCKYNFRVVRGAPAPLIALLKRAALPPTHTHSLCKKNIMKREPPLMPKHSRHFGRTQMPPRHEFLLVWKWFLLRKRGASACGGNSARINAYIVVHNYCDAKAVCSAVTITEWWMRANALSQY